MFILLNHGFMSLQLVAGKPTTPLMIWMIVRSSKPGNASLLSVFFVQITWDEFEANLIQPEMEVFWCQKNV